VSSVFGRAARNVALRDSVGLTTRWSRWRGGWRVALRLARRDALHAKGRSLLVLLLVALPVATVSGMDTIARQSAAAHTPAAFALSNLGAVADAAVAPVTRGQAVQGITLGVNSSSGDAPAPTPDQMLAELPSGSQMVGRGSLVSAAIEAGQWGAAESLWMQDVRDPLIAGLWKVRSGALPVRAGEIAIATMEAQRLHVGVGDQVTVTPLDVVGRARQLQVTGIADNGYQGGVGVVLPKAIDGVPLAKDLDYLVHTSRSLTWADVRRANAAGMFVTSRSVIMNPPSFCEPDVLCGDHGPIVSAEASNPPPPADPNAVAKTLALSTLVVVLVIMQVALLAGPAFAVQLRRRQRELGLVSASGGDAATLRRVVLASGVVLGVVGALMGVVLGWVVACLLPALLPFQVLGDLGTGPESGVPLPGPEILGVAAVGVLAAVAAALVPAMSAGRGGVIDTLRGRRPLPKINQRKPLIGLALGGAGLLAMFYGTKTLDAVVLCAGVIAGELGLIVIMPALVVAAGQLGRWLPLAARLAVRDAGRHRMRTAAAACAIAAAAASSVAVSAWAQSAAQVAVTVDVSFVQGTLLAQIVDQTQPDGQVISAKAAVRSVLSVVATSLPGAKTAVLANVVPKSAVDPWGGQLACVLPGADPASADTDRPCQGRVSSLSSPLTGSIVLIEDPAALGAVLGPLAPLAQAQAALNEGKALVMQSGLTNSAGQLSLREQRYDPAGNLVAGPLIAVPALDVTAGAVPAAVIVGPAALKAGTPLGDAAKPQVFTVVVDPAQPDTLDAPTSQARLQFALAKAGLPSVGLIVIEQLPQGDTVFWLALGASATALLALLAGLMVTSLALVDGRGDLRTLAAIGADPRIRRRIAASSAAFVSLVGVGAGAFSGLIAARLLVPLFISRGEGAFVTPWSMLLLVVVGVPLLTTGVAWSTTRSRIAVPWSS